QKGMKAAQMRLRVRPAETGDQGPARVGLLLEPGRVRRRGIVVRRDLREKTVRGAGFPRINQVTLPARAFVAEFANVNVWPGTEPHDALIFRNVFRIICLERTPNGEQHAALFGAVHLKAEVALAEAVRHEVGTDDV